MASYVPLRFGVGLGLGIMFIILLWLFLWFCCLDSGSVILSSNSHNVENSNSPGKIQHNDDGLRWRGGRHRDYCGRIAIQTVSPKDVWRLTDLERFALPIAGNLRRLRILEEGQNRVTFMDECGTNHELETYVLGSSPEAAPQGTTSFHLSHLLKML